MSPAPVQSAHFNVNCLDIMLGKPRLSYEWLRFDSNDDCNLHCVYCHNSRSNQVMELATFQGFLDRNVDQISNFQFGCRMEPTLDTRLVDFMEALHGSSARPTRTVVLQTNAILLHRHDAARMVAAGLTDIQLSIDTLDEAVFSALRGGAKIGKILRNIKRVSETHPQVRVKFIVTVAKSNLPHVEDLVAFGSDIGIASAIVREMFHTPGTNRVDDGKMATLVLEDGEFDDLSARLKARFDGHVVLNCIDAKGIKLHNAPVQAHSYRQTPTG